jgi:hypothetical protein
MVDRRRTEREEGRGGGGDDDDGDIGDGVEVGISVVGLWLR